MNKQATLEELEDAKQDASEAYFAAKNYKDRKAARIVWNDSWEALARAIRNSKQTKD